MSKVLTPVLLVGAAALLLVQSVAAQQACTARPDPAGAPLRGQTSVTVGVLVGVPPQQEGHEELNARLTNALSQGIAKWSAARASDCSEDELPALSLGSPGVDPSRTVPVVVRPGKLVYDDPATPGEEGPSNVQTCRVGTQVGTYYPPAAAMAATINGVAYPKVIFLFQHNHCDLQPLEETFAPGSPYIEPTNFANLFAHELGHALGLDHDNCDAGVMNSRGSRLYDGTPKEVTPEECNLAGSLNFVQPPWGNLDPCDILPFLDGCSDNPDPTQGRGPWFNQCEYIPGGRMCYHPEYEWCIDSVFEICDPPAYALTNDDECVVTESTWRCDDPPIGSVDTATVTVPGGPGPNITFLAPNDNEAVSGEVPVGFTAAHAQVGVHTVRVFVDGQPATLRDWQERLPAPAICLDPAGADPTCPNIGYVGYLNTRALSNGTHKIGVMVFDNRIPYQRMTWAERTIVVNNVGCTDTTKPSVSITAPVNGATVSGTVGITATATDNTAVSKVNFTIDGSLAVADTTSPYGFTWDARTATVGPHTIQANAFDACGNNRWSAIVTVNVPPPAPEVSVTRASDGVAVVDGGSASLGSVPVNVATSMRFRIGNTGNANLVLSNPGSLVAGPCFQQIETPSTPIPPGGEAFFRVRLLCATPGNQGGTVTIGTNDADENPFDIALSGSVTLPSAAEISLSRAADGVAITDGGAAFLGSTSSGVAISQRFRVFNSGTGDLVLANPTSLVTGACFQQIETPTSPIPPGGEAFFRVRFLCAAGGTHTGAVALSSNDADESPYDITLSGTVVVANPPDIAVTRAFDGVAVPDGGSVAIGTAAVGTSTSMRFRIVNSGSGALAISNASTLVSGTCFQQIETPITPVPAGGESFFRVRLLCGTPGTVSGAVAIASDDPDESPYDISLTGTVTP